MQTGRTARLLATLMLLKSREWVSAADLATRFDISLRTVYRDIEALQSYGIPVVGVPGPEGGYRLDRDQAVEPLLFSSDQATGLALLGSGADLPPALQRSTDTLLERMQELMPRREARLIQSTRERIYFDTTDWYWTDEGVTWLAAVRECVLSSRLAWMKYRPRRAREPHSETVEPLGLAWKAGQWYLVFRTQHTRTIDRVRLSNMLAFEPANARFTYPSDFDLREWWTRDLAAFGQGPTRVVIVGRPDARDELLRLRRKDTTEIEEHDGTVTVSLFVDEWDWLVPLVLSYGESVIVREPRELRDAIAKAAANTARLYAHEEPFETGPQARTDDSRLRTTRGRVPPK